MAERKLIPIAEARARLGVSKATMARLVKEGRFSIYENPIDRRSKLIDEEELITGLEPRLLRPETTPSKMAT